ASWPKNSEELDWRVLRKAWSHSGSVEEASTASLLAKRQLACNLEKSPLACSMPSESNNNNNNNNNKEDF
ncbi:hypothetical protein, partial [Thiolapillus sp.]|uniref:hypothetical protein n=1 Tax=Thiolapillus sp. TaxID=2017437 RepID=UPI003AF8CDE9